MLDYVTFQLTQRSPYSSALKLLFAFISYDLVQTDSVSYKILGSNVIARYVKSSHQNDPGRMSSKFYSHFSPFVPFFNPAPARITERNSSFIFLNRFVRRDSDLIPRPSNRISTSLLTNTHRSPWVPPSPQKNSLISPRCP